MDGDDSLCSVQDYFARLANIPFHYAPSDTRGDADRKKFCAICLKQQRDGAERELTKENKKEGETGCPGNLTFKTEVAPSKTLSMQN